MVWIGKYTTRYGDHFYFVFRVIIGLLFTMHGAQKLFGSFGGPGIEGFAQFASISVGLAYVPALVEFIGGLFIIFGLLTRWSALLGAIVMVFAWIMIHIPSGWNPLLNGGEAALLFFVSFLVILWHGSRKWGLDKIFFKNVY